ncbi:ATP-dependent helicase [Radiobacillus kanasensis]|uniref:ATP-dependent helicase n=1 Tax=Radiobacillus kanasensis TaxID=2844358 RepID=UPI001E29B355|nr:ATP-dependent helicase [Radiobacillus kanasensis]UFU00843.1 ATP-dependent helicase [Radiobacillus kanasensis]
MMETITGNLNNQQREAVFDESGPLLIIAGPGSGKTTILTRRIARILSDSTGEKFKILALTFTTKAANEMKERVEQLAGDEVNRLLISTFHGFCFDVLRKYGSYIGLNNEFTIYDQSSETNDYVEILIDAVNEEIMQNNPTTCKLLSSYSESSTLRNSAPKLLNAISKLKNQLKGPEDIPINSRKFDPSFKLIYKLYNEKLRVSNAIDYGDLLYLTYRLFKEKPFISKQYRRIFKHLLIDEAQDTNKAQFELVRSFCGSDYRNIFIVADEDQLIYEWNDAKFEYLLEFVKIYEAKTIQMFENYRCPEPVLNMANRLIKLNVNRLAIKRDLKANKSTSESVVELNEYKFPEDESEDVTVKIKQLNEYNNTCIIARNRFVLKQMEMDMKEKGIPYNYPSTSERFLSREAKIVIALLQAVFNEDDKVHINLLCDYFGKDINEILSLNDQTLFRQFLNYVQEENETLVRYLLELLNKKAYFLDGIERLFEELTDLNLNEDTDDEVNSTIFDDFKQLQTIIRRYKKDRDTDERSIGDFLSYLALSPKGNQIQSGVTLLTGHAAKGLEFDHVFIVSVNQGIFPDFRSIENQRALEEERRNFFVAITRTKKKLYLSYTLNKKTRFGYIQQKPSQFLQEIGLLD